MDNLFLEENPYLLISDKYETDREIVSKDMEQGYTKKFK